MTAPIARARFQHGGRPMTIGEIASSESNRDPSARAEPMADWLSQAELDDIEHDACTDGLMIGVALGFAVGVPVAYLLLRWLS